MEENGKESVRAIKTINYEARCRATINVRIRIASLNIVPEVFLLSFRQVSRCRVSRSCSFRHGGPTAARADAVKVGRRADLEAGAAGDRPHLDGVEHDAMLEPSQDGTWTSGDRSLWVMLLRADCVTR
jgi:hypothetical protein